jgi:hypothetical protein
MQDELKWDEHLYWCPTQLYRTVYVKGFKFTLYLRWRHDDPFQFHILSENEMNDIFEIGWNCELFSDHKIFCTSKQYKNAEKKADQLWRRFYKPKILQKIKDNPEVLI